MACKAGNKLIRDQARCAALCCADAWWMEGPAPPAVAAWGRVHQLEAPPAGRPLLAAEPGACPDPPHPLSPQGNVKTTNPDKQASFASAPVVAGGAGGEAGGKDASGGKGASVGSASKKRGTAGAQAGQVQAGPAGQGRSHVLSCAPVCVLVRSALPPVPPPARPSSPPAGRH